MGPNKCLDFGGNLGYHLYAGINITFCRHLVNDGFLWWCFV